MNTIALDAKTISPAPTPPPVTTRWSACDQWPPETAQDSWPSPDTVSVDHLITENDDPVDNIFSEKQQRLLTNSLYASWTGPGQGRTFLTMANVGLFYALHSPPIVPDVLVSLDVQMPADVWKKAKRSYLVGEYGKPPELVIEIVSNQEGEEDGRKFQLYAQAKVPYYVIFDPINELEKGVLRVHQRRGNRYVELQDHYLSQVGLGVTLWEGRFEDKYETWLRFCDKAGHLLLTGAEQFQQERQAKELVLSRLTRERQDKERERQDKELAQLQRDQLAATLRSLGINPEELLKK